MKDKVASILGESKSTYASSMKVSNSNNEKSSSEKKPLFYRRDNQNDVKIEVKDGKEYKRIGNNFRIIRSPNSRNKEEQKSANIVRVNDPNVAAFNRTQYKRNTVTSNPSNITQLPNMGLMKNNLVSRNTNFSSNKAAHFKCFNNEIVDANQIIHESNKPNDTNSTIRKDSRDPRQK